MLQLPPGFIFQPSDEVLLLSYLLPKEKGEPLPCPDVVKEIDRYQMRPDEIWYKLEGPSFGNRDRFFITKSRLPNEQIRYVRTVDGGGTWSQEEREVVYSDDTKKTSIGMKRRFSFKSREQRGGWVLHEYRLNSSVLPSSPHYSYVLCRLRKNIDNNNNNRINCHKRKAQSELRDSHTEAVNQPITLVPNSKHKQGEIDISRAQTLPQLQDYEQSEIEKSEPQSRLQTQVQDNPTNLVFPSNFYQPFPSTTNSAHEQDNIERTGAEFQSQHQDIFGTEIYGAQSQPQPQLQDYEQSEIEKSEPQSRLQTQVQDNPTNLVLPSNVYQPFLSTTNSAHEQDEIERNEAWLQTQVQDNPTNLVFPSSLCQPFLSTTNSAHEQDDFESAWLQGQQEFLGTEIYGAQPQPQPDGSCISVVVDFSSIHHQHANHGF